MINVLAPQIRPKKWARIDEIWYWLRLTVFKPFVSILLAGPQAQRSRDMVFKRKASRPPKEPEQSAFKPALPEKRKAEVPRQVQHSFINVGTTVTGDLESAGDISVEGSVEGNITCRTLTLRGEPTIMGDVHAEAVYVCGRFTGDLHTKKVVLTKTARMIGDIYYETLELQEGAEFEGGFSYTGGSALKPVTRDAASPRGPGELVHAE